MSKKISLIVLAVVLVFTIIIPSKVFAADGKKVLSVETVQEDNELTVSGEVEEGMLAVAVQALDKDGNLIKIETGAVDENNKYEVVLELQTTAYTVKVADFDGGEVVTKVLIEDKEDKEDEEVEESKEKKESSPKTGDMIAIWVGGIVLSLIAIAGIVKYKKNRK